MQEDDSLHRFVLLGRDRQPAFESQLYLATLSCVIWGKLLL